MSALAESKTSASAVVLTETAAKSWPKRHSPRLVPQGQSSQENRQDEGWRGLWITIERDPAKAGGLGEVSKTIPAELNAVLGADVRVIVPGTASDSGRGRMGGHGRAGGTAAGLAGTAALGGIRLLQRYEEATQHVGVCGRPRPVFRAVPAFVFPRKPRGTAGRRPAVPDGHALQPGRGHLRAAAQWHRDGTRERWRPSMATVIL